MKAGFKKYRYLIGYIDRRENVKLRVYDAESRLLTNVESHSSKFGAGEGAPVIRIVPRIRNAPVHGLEDGERGGC